MLDEEIVEKNIGLVKSCISKFSFKTSDYDDLFQSGCLGLTRAAQNFDLSRGTKFSTYAVPFILGEIKNFFYSNRKLKVSRDNRKIYNLINLEQERFLEKNHRMPSISELSKNLDISSEKIIEVIENHNSVLSIDDDENLNTLNKVSEESHEKLVLEKLDIQKAIESLDTIDKKIMNMRFFEFKTQSNCAKILGLSQVQISRKERKIIKKLRLAIL